MTRRAAIRPTRARRGAMLGAMRVWIDQDCCTGAGLCVDHCPELFIVLEDGIGYVHDGAFIVGDTDSPSMPVPRRYEQSAVDAAERCPGECIYLEPDTTRPASVDDHDIVDAEVVESASGLGFAT